MIAIVAGPPCSTKRLPQTLRRLQRGDRLLGELEQPPLGSHLITPRRGFAHHGLSTWVVVRSFTISQLYAIYGACQWQRFLWQTSRRDVRSGYEGTVSPASMEPR